MISLVSSIIAIVGLIGMILCETLGRKAKKGFLARTLSQKKLREKKIANLRRYPKVEEKRANRPIDYLEDFEYLPDEDEYFNELIKEAVANDLEFLHLLFPDIY